MGIIEAILLGVIQGITEFLPVSSSGHLVLAQKILGISEPALLFDTLVHLGTLAAVFVVLREDIWKILRRPLQPLTGFLILGTIPAVIIALVFKEPIERAFQTGTYLGFAFLFTAAALLISEFLSRRRGKARREGAMNWPDALVIGVCQGIAIIPGVSRSGLTLSGSLSRGLERGFAARFSFLLSIPAILGALVLQIKDLVELRGAVLPGAAVQNPATGGAAALNGVIGPAALIAGTLTAAAVGFFSIKFMLKIIRERSLTGFAVYTAVLGLLVLADQYISHFFF